MPKLDKWGRDKSSLLSEPTKFVSALDRDLNYENTPYTPPTQISKGTLTTNLGGVFEIRDETGTVVLLTADPVTKVVTIAGSLVANVGVNIGTMANSHITGTTTLEGTVTNSGLLTAGTYSAALIGTSTVQGGTVANALLGTSQITGGTVNASVYQSGGTEGLSGSIVYLKAPSGTGTLSFNNGLILAST